MASARCLSACGASTGRSVRAHPEGRLGALWCCDAAGWLPRFAAGRARHRSWPRYFGWWWWAAGCFELPAAGACSRRLQSAFRQPAHGTAAAPWLAPRRWRARAPALVSPGLPLRRALAAGACWSPTRLRSRSAGAADVRRSVAVSFLRRQVCVMLLPAPARGRGLVTPQRHPADSTSYPGVAVPEHRLAHEPGQPPYRLARRTPPAPQPRSAAGEVATRAPPATRAAARPGASALDEAMVRRNAATFAGRRSALPARLARTPATTASASARARELCCAARGWRSDFQPAGAESSAASCRPGRDRSAAAQAQPRSEWVERQVAHPEGETVGAAAASDWTTCSTTTPTAELAGSSWPLLRAPARTATDRGRRRHQHRSVRWRERPGRQARRHRRRWLEGRPRAAYLPEVDAAACARRCAKLSRPARAVRARGDGGGR